VTVGLRAADRPTIEHTPLGNTTNTVDAYSVPADPAFEYA
jgi:hypothetical protein